MPPVARPKGVADAKRANAGTTTKNPPWRAVASPQGQQPPADELQKRKAVEEKFLNRLFVCQSMVRSAHPTGYFIFL